MHCPLSHGRNSFHSRSYQAHSPQPDGGDLTLVHICDDALDSTAAYTRNCEATGVAYDVATVAERPIAPASPAAPTAGSPDEPPPDLKCPLNDGQRKSFLRMWNTVPPTFAVGISR